MSGERCTGQRSPSSDSDRESDRESDKESDRESDKDIDREQSGGLGPGRPSRARS